MNKKNGEMDAKDKFVLGKDCCGLVFIRKGLGIRPTDG